MQAPHSRVWWEMLAAGWSLNWAVGWNTSLWPLDFSTIERLAPWGCVPETVPGESWVPVSDSALEIPVPLPPHSASKTVTKLCLGQRGADADAHSGWRGVAVTLEGEHIGGSVCCCGRFLEDTICHPM